MITTFKLFEIFDAHNVYDYEMIDEIKSHYDGIGDYTTYIYKFTSKDQTNYYVRVNYFYNMSNEERYETFLTLDYMDEEQYNQESSDDFGDIKYKNLGKFDAIKVLNTVFNILKYCYEKLNPWVICFNSTLDRYKIYDFCINKYVTGYILTDYDDNDDKKQYALYNDSYYYITDDGENIKRKDNDLLVY